MTPALLLRPSRPRCSARSRYEEVATKNKALEGECGICANGIQPSLKSVEAVIETLTVKHDSDVRKGRAKSDKYTSARHSMRQCDTSFQEHGIALSGSS